MRVTDQEIAAVLNDRASAALVSVVKLALDLRDARADARALWAVRVLDAWQELNPGAHAFATPVKLDGSGWKCVSFSYPRVLVGATPDAARLSAAEAVYPTLPADVRAKLGERP